MVNRTGKTFKPYNCYNDRGMGLKWPTAFALGELATTINKGKKEATKAIKRLPQQSRKQIEYYLKQSIESYKILEIQLNTLDDLGRVKDHIFGIFRGFSEQEVLLIGDQSIDFADIRHIIIHDFVKWSDLSKLQ